MGLFKKKPSVQTPIAPQSPVQPGVASSTKVPATVLPTGSNGGIAKLEKGMLSLVDLIGSFLC